MGTGIIVESSRQFKKRLLQSAVAVRFPLYKHRSHHYNARSFRGTGGIAQLGERLHGMQEVSGSIPLTSTKRA